ncbi:MAG TPA: glycoside hydrolase family 43 protein [Acidimicrobiales bacterium]|nr:glycoside hydrolase family 43 protein [Acidimicrobiales bacterium]
MALLCIIIASPVQSAAETTPAWRGDFPDPTVVRDGTRFLAFGTGPRVPVLASDDLVTWTALPPALDGVAAWAEDRDVWAPGVALVGGRWRLYYAVPRRADGTHCVSVASADSAAGPYHDDSAGPVVCQAETQGSIDPEPFIDADGSAWLLWKSQGRPEDNEAALWSSRLSGDGLSLVGDAARLLTRERDWERPLVENPSMARWRGRYLLTYSAGLWQGPDYATGYAVCTRPSGPCARAEDGPALAGDAVLAGTGGGSLFTDDRGRLVLAFHAWDSDAVGSEAGGARRMHVVPVAGEAGALRLDGAPFGVLDGIDLRPGAVVARGWAIDPDQPAADVAVTIDGIEVVSAPALGRRPDVDRTHPGWGAATGFAIAAPMAAGTHRVCVVGRNRGLGRPRQLGCRAVRMDGDPRGSFDSAARFGDQAVVRGWAVDPDQQGPATVFVYLDGAPVAAPQTGERRPDVAVAFPSWGSDRGWAAVVGVGPGRHEVCATVYNRGAGSGRTLGCRAV